MAGHVDDNYVERRRRVGEMHARIGLPLNTYFAGMNMFTWSSTTRSWAGRNWRPPSRSV
jgi:rsbT co-antagonist protein RsbR